MTNKLIQGDCLDILKMIDDDTIDLIYLDPPFFSQRDYEIQGIGFSDKFNSMEHYIEWLKVRVEEMHRILKPTGSIYLHCDWHADAYIRVQILDKIFGAKHFINDIAWSYNTGGVSKRWFARKHDTIFLYSKSKKYTFNPIEIKEYYDKKPGFHDRNGGQDKKGYYRMIYATDTFNIKSVFNMSKEYIGYPTQKPEALLERIIKASSNDGDIVLDPFCGSGTTLKLAQNLGRKWIGIDISEDSINICKERLGL